MAGESAQAMHRSFGFTLNLYHLEFLSEVVFLKIM